MENTKGHFVLVHGGCHGAWCWYKLATLLKSAGYRVTTLDMAASGINLTQLEELQSISEYSKPLMDHLASLPSDEKVILVGHSFGGITISWAMERFPDKIAVAVFVTAIMPGPDLSLTTLLHEYSNTRDSQLDNKFFFDNGMDKRPTSFVFGNEFLSSKLYQHCPPEDLTLAQMLVRPLFLLGDDNIIEDVSFSKEKYGSVRRVYILSGEDKIIKQDFQQWMIENNPTEEVKEITNADHMVMLSKPQELCAHLQAISQTYS
ncbi:hypothetical protein IFM89_032059 [Coptis chinensis]|uniref:AB hydrolase-1 domain-containing protein n=1 Tax=Coptis chinensis TaxID=261450 RepID=A0A835I2F8_9MAGN|nr:hypothetical protein IFM89_032059 [Coptis chinensis]